MRDHAQLIDQIGAKSGGGPVEIKRGDASIADISVSGAEPIIAQIEKTDIAEGRFFSEAENDNSLHVAFVGTDVVDKLFPQGDAVGGEQLVLADDLDAKVVRAGVGLAGCHQEQSLAEADLALDGMVVAEQLPPVHRPGAA